jgi:hypothetical protein
MKISGSLDLWISGAHCDDGVYSQNSQVSLEVSDYGFK